MDPIPEPLPRIVPFHLPEEDDDEEDSSPYPILGKLRRKDFELWVKRSADGTLSLKWWRWRDDQARFSPMDDGELALDPSELLPLAELLASVGSLLRSRGQL